MARFAGRMGVPGLLKALSDIQQEVHVSLYKGLCVGLDAYCFLHRGKHACAEAMLDGRAASDAFLRPVLEAVESLRAQGAEPLLVFDGGPLPAKRAVEESRQLARQEACWRAATALRRKFSGDAASPAGTRQTHFQGSTAAARLLGNAVDVTPEMAVACIQRMRALQVECIVAPCEADAQLAHLALTGRISVCATEDVDLLAYGCPRVLFGLDPMLSASGGAAKCASQTWGGVEGCHLTA